VIEKFEFVSIDELQEIKHEITPMIKGQATKQRLFLIRAFIVAMQQFKMKPAEEVLNKILELVRSMVIELITSVNCSNLKIR
jgi:hypothetical protein